MKKRLALTLALMLALIQSGISRAAEVRIVGDELGSRCSSLIAPARLAPSEYAKIQAWEKEHLNGVSKPFLRAWRLVLHRKRLQWVNFCERAGDACAEYVNALSTLRNTRNVTKVLEQLAYGPDAPLPSVAEVEAFVLKIRSTVPIFNKVREIDMVGEPVRTLVVRGPWKKNRNAYLRPSTRPRLSEWIAQEGDEVFSEEKFRTKGWGSSGVVSPYPDGIVPWGYRKSFTWDVYESHFFQIRDLEHEVLKIQREEGQIDDEIPELLAGDLLEPGQTLLIEHQSSVSIGKDELLSQSERWSAAGRHPYPISYWTGDPVTQDGKFVVTDAVVRVVRNFTWPEVPPGHEGPRLKQLEFHPLQWERSHLPPEELEKLNGTALPGSKVLLRYELGRAYGRDRDSFSLVLVSALEVILTEWMEIRKMGFDTDFVFEIHAGSKRNADYYAKMFEFEFSPDVAHREDHWVLTGNPLSLYLAVMRRLGREVIPGLRR